MKLILTMLLINSFFFAAAQKIITLTDKQFQKSLDSVVSVVMKEVTPLKRPVALTGATVTQKGDTLVINLSGFDSTAVYRYINAIRTADSLNTLARIAAEKGLDTKILNLNIPAPYNDAPILTRLTTVEGLGTRVDALEARKIPATATSVSTSTTTTTTKTTLQ